MAIVFKRQSQHLRWAGFFFIIDASLVWASFLFGIFFRFGEFSFAKLLEYSPSVILSSLVLPSIFYVGGLYSARRLEGGWMFHLGWLLVGFASAAIAVLVMGSLDFSARIGRGVLLAALGFSIVTVTARHILTVHRKKRRWETYLFLVTNKEDESASVFLNSMWKDKARHLGVIIPEDFALENKWDVLATVEELIEGEAAISVDIVLVRDHHFKDPRLAAALRSFRYQGAELMSLVDACEEVYQAVPLALISENWLLRASSQSNMFYIRKLKRMFDIVCSIFFLVVLSPALLVGVLLVLFSSREGPVIFRQKRTGRWQRPFTAFKLRTMQVNSEAKGAKWSGDSDQRVFPAGHFLRKFRIDEIPQLINVLKGEMSFVGPRPEQIEISKQLIEEIPFYRERILIQPGLTGLAQVRFPYGSSVEDAARKLEYDLYYMKHMSLLLDFFILLETVRTVINGGVRIGGDKEYLAFTKSISSDSVRKTRSEEGPAKVVT